MAPQDRLAERFPLLGQGLLPIRSVTPGDADWLPRNWESSVYPKGRKGAENIEAVLQWLDYQVWLYEERLIPSLDNPDLAPEEPGQTNRGGPVRDAYRVVDELRESRDWRLAPPCRPPREYMHYRDDLRAVVAELRKVGDWVVEAAKLETAGGESETTLGQAGAEVGDSTYPCLKQARDEATSCLDGIRKMIGASQNVADNRMLFGPVILKRFEEAYRALTQAFGRLGECYPAARKELETARPGLPHRGIATACGVSEVFALDVAFRLAEEMIRYIQSVSDVPLNLENLHLYLKLISISTWVSGADELRELKAKVRAECMDAVGVLRAVPVEVEVQGEGTADNTSENGRVDGASKEQGTQKKPQSGKVNLGNWAVGHDGEKWWLFQWFPNKKKLCQRGAVDIPAGLATHLALELGQRNGQITKGEAIERFKNGDRRHWLNKKIFDSVCKPARKRLANAIRLAIARTAQTRIDADPIPWDNSLPGWVAAVQIGAAGKSKEGKLEFSPLVTEVTGNVTAG